MSLEWLKTDSYPFPDITTHILHAVGAGAQWVDANGRGLTHAALPGVGPLRVEIVAPGVAAGSPPSVPPAAGRGEGTTGGLFPHRLAGQAVIAPFFSR